MGKKTAKKPYSGIKSWPEDDRPREKLFREGEHRLSNTELLAILLRTGVKGQTALDLARKILQKFKDLRNLSHTDLSHWKEVKGVGRAKIAQIKAALEIARRFGEEIARKNRSRLRSLGEAAEILMPRMRDLKKEIFKILLLNSQNRLMDIVEIAEGTVNQANPIIREIFQKTLQGFAPSIICVHNHPSGDPQPSQEDREFTRKLVQAGNILQVKVLDHIIIGDNHFFSFADNDLI